MSHRNQVKPSTTPQIGSRGKIAPKDLSHHLSAMANRRKESSISPFSQAISSSVFNLGAGFPFPGNFPNDTLEGAIAKVTRFPLHPVSPLSPPSLDTSRFTVPKYSSLTPGSIDPAEQIDLASALQYQSSSGYPSLAAFIRDFALNYQNQGKIPYSNPGTLITGGAADGFSKCLMTFADVGDNILVEEFVYFQAKDMVGPFGVGLVPVKLDDEGMSAKSLAVVLSRWDEKKQGKKPHMMYTVTIGQNPTGGILSLHRKKEIYKLCQKHDVLIFEDDPYWSLQYDIPENATSNADNLLSSLAPSYVTIDTDGRVLGLQTFTKVLAPGCRVGWVVAQPAFIEKLTFATDGTTSNPSGFAEAVLSQLLLREWGIDGFVRWIDGLRINYLGRRNLLCEALAEGQDLIVTAQPSLENQHSTNVELHDTYVLFPTIPGPKKRKHTSSDVDEEHRPGSKSRVRMYEFRVPPAGFYVWVQINLSSHPLSHPARDGKPQLSSHDIILRLWKHLVGAPYHLLTLPGNVFAATPEVERDTEKDVGFLRLTFAAVEVRDLTKVGLLFGEALKSFWEGTGWDLHADGAGGVQTSDEMGALDTAGETKRVVKGYLSARGTRIC